MQTQHAMAANRYVASTLRYRDPLTLQIIEEGSVVSFGDHIWHVEW
jgi:hypothetical protein